MRTIIICVIVCMIAGCGMEEVANAPHANPDGIWVGASISDPYDVCYITALDYPDGYDWRSDPEKGNVNCKLVLFADGIPILKIPVGDSYMVSAADERHRVVVGDLYTDFTDGSITVVKKNGKILYICDAAETVEDMLVLEGRVHTLSVPLGGSGFRYRVDGDLVVERDSGKFYSRMTVHNDTVAFCFSQNTMTAQGSKINSYCVKNGKVQKVDLGATVSHVWDMIFHKGQIYMVATYSSGFGPVLVTQQKKEYVNYFLAQDMLYCRFMDSDRICVNARCIYATSNYMTDFLWFEDSYWYMYRTGEPLSSIYVDNKSYNATINPSDDSEGLIFKGTRAYGMPEGYLVRGRNPIVRKDSRLIVGLTSRSGGPPLVWTDESVDTLDINGYITGVSIVKR